MELGKYDYCYVSTLSSEDQKKEDQKKVRYISLTYPTRSAIAPQPPLKKAIAPPTPLQKAIAP